MPKVETVDKMRWAIWAGSYNYWQEVHPRHLVNNEAPQMGGSEASALTIASTLAEFGHHVLFACKTPYIERVGNLTLCPPDVFETTVFTESYDALVSWDAESLFRYNFEHIPVKVVCYQLNHSEHPIYGHVVDLFFHPSQWHANRFNEVFKVPAEKQLPLMTNATRSSWFQEAYSPGDTGLGRGRDGKRVVWASSPDRGLHHLLRVWPRVVEAEPNAKLDIYYDMDRWLETIEVADSTGRHLITTDRAHAVRNLLRMLVHDDAMHVQYHGGVGKQEVIKAFLESHVLAYPCDPVAPTEGFSMTCLEAWAAGCQLVISDADALPELWGGLEGVTVLPLPIDDELLARTIINDLSRPVIHGPRELPQALTYDNLAHLWEVEVDKCLQSNSTR